MKTKFILFLSVLLTCAQSVPVLSKASKTSTIKSSISMFTPILAQRENCLDYDRDFKPSPQTRIIDLKQFGVQVKISKNLRTMLRNNGEVWILTPVDYDLIACTARGGIGGRGLYYRYIRRIPNPLNLPLNKWVAQRERAKKKRMGYGYQSSIEPYQFSGLNGLLVESRSRLNSSTYFVKIPRINDVVEIGVGCDCDIESKEVYNFLKRVSLM
ncbi:hypothetical protein [Acaryochloris sp. IP29b_bin.137]|uniref:hypothetical protein n=1 Tax=Acaryochloris sp. IP29b_bin.137 TaxID=2969217 RepID=UPI0026378AE6|nr:hypothetical protein [Acaryochloris sp. IP29b_bin.137]